MDKVKGKKPIERAAYFPPNMELMVNEWNEGAETGEPSRIDEMNEIFAWKRGFVSGWYGWANDGKGTFFDFVSLMKAKVDGWKWCLFKPEDMSSRKTESGIVITADDIYNNLVWALTGKTPYKNFAKSHGLKVIPLDEYMAAIEWIERHFFVLYPKDRRFKSLMDDFKFYYEKFGIDGFLVDPWKSVVMEKSGETIDQVLNTAFIEIKEFSLQTNSSFNIISHPKSMMDVKEKNGAYKVVNQYMIAGGAQWDNNMDSQYSIYRPERHLSPSDPKVHFINLKQRKAEIVGVKRGIYENIRFDFLTKRYFFNGVCPIDGSMREQKHKATASIFDYTESAHSRNDENPFVTPKVDEKTGHPFG